ncbi:unnamed protein product [Caenorhabditis sp. 36 PRJEB53466]|nr:unnamed protein product [Caenorhabditis sp. 36 PRJEB53466]
MRQGNTTEQAAPWNLEFRWDRIRPPKWQKPNLMYTHIFLKLFCAVFVLFQHWIPGNKYFEEYKGFLCDNLFFEHKMIFYVSVLFADFFITKNVLGPRLTGLHHGFKKDEETGQISYHFYAEKNFLTRYSSIDRDAFFTVFVFSSAWSFLKIFMAMGTVLWRWWLPVEILAFTGVYLNLWLFVQTRYYRQWTMQKFAGAWLYNFFVRVKFNYEEGSSFKNGWTPRY